VMMPFIQPQAGEIYGGKCLKSFVCWAFIHLFNAGEAFHIRLPKGKKHVEIFIGSHVLFPLPVFVASRSHEGLLWQNLLNMADKIF
jgi:hypothetical protein